MLLIKISLLKEVIWRKVAYLIGKLRPDEDNER
jgi:hypothetical protein